MATEYRLTLAGSTPVEQVAARALPDPAERPTGTPPLLAADLYDRYGFELIVLAGQHGYFDAESDGGLWEWEPAGYVDLTFRMEQHAASGRAVAAMLPILRRVLRSGPEDAALVLNGNWLLLTRVDGTLAQHRESWWQAHPAAGELILG